VLQASASSRPAGGGGGIGAYVRAHPVVVLGTVAGLFVLGFGGYVYMQIFHPGLLAGRPPIASKGVAPPLAQAPAAPVPGEPLSSAALLKEAAAEAAAAKPAPEAAPAKPQAAPPPTPDEAARSGNTIVVSRGSPAPVLNPLLTDAYSALQANQLDSAQNLYQQLLRAEPKSVDALLGLAAIAARQGNDAEATRLYLQILELDPRHALAQTGLIALLGRADPLAAESRLRQLIAREPSAYLYFTLGNLYADQSQWAPAQQAYFQAHHLEPANPDYAYNLAVGLEHVSQPKLALGFYRRAAQLAAARGRANFEPARVQERIGRLAQQVE
jgi:tetratricopeptide (TPR) repeat protein